MVPFVSFVDGNNLQNINLDAKAKVYDFIKGKSAKKSLCFTRYPTYTLRK